MASEKKRSMALSLAVEEQRGDGPGALRDTMISTALDEGNSVADVAEALGLTVQAVYKAQAQQPSEPRGPQGAGADERAVVVALEAMTDAVAFEQLVNALIGDVEPAAVPLGGSGDRGRDAADPGSKVISRSASTSNGNARSKPTSRRSRSTATGRRRSSPSLTGAPHAKQSRRWPRRSPRRESS